MIDDRAASQLGGCIASVERGTLSVLGNETANIIEIAGTAGGVQVTCDGASNIYEGVEEIVVEAGDGDDQITKEDRDGLLGAVATRLFGQDGNDLSAVRYLERTPTTGGVDVVDGGPGDNLLKIFTTVRADRIEIVPGTDAGSAEVRVTDIGTETILGSVSISRHKFLSVKAGGGDDQFDVAQLGAIGLSLSGEEGDDRVVWTYQLLPFIEQDSLYDGGSGRDKFDLVGASAAEHYGVGGAPDRAIPDPRIRVTDPATGLLVADLFVQQTEEIGIATGGGDDRLDLQWDAVGMSGLTAFVADLGDGDDAVAVALLPVLVAPPTGEAQTASLEIQTGQGDDQITFQHAAGSWFDIALTARPGAGEDRFRAELSPPPDDGLPGPEGLRTLQFQVLAGNDSDFVGIMNQTGGDFFEVFFESELGRGDDFCEAAGLITLAAKPGRGFDTARVTRNLVPFVTEFERVEILEGSP